jgi:hypothetical protein
MEIVVGPPVARGIESTAASLVTILAVLVAELPQPAITSAATTTPNARDMRGIDGTS